MRRTFTADEFRQGTPLPGPRDRFDAYGRNWQVVYVRAADATGPVRVHAVTDDEPVANASEHLYRDPVGEHPADEVAGHIADLHPDLDPVRITRYARYVHDQHLEWYEGDPDALFRTLRSSYGTSERAVYGGDPSARRSGLGT